MLVSISALHPQIYRAADQDCKERLSEVTEITKRALDLLKEERERWKELHSDDPAVNKGYLYQSGEKMILHITVQSRVKNMINNRPIIREYTFDCDALKDRPIFGKLDMTIYAAANLNTGIRPGIQVGWRPFQSMKVPKAVANIGFGIYTTFTSAGASIYYTFPGLRKLTILGMAGYNYEGKVSPGIGVGMSF